MYFTIKSSLKKFIYIYIETKLLTVNLLSINRL